MTGNKKRALIAVILLLLPWSVLGIAGFLLPAQYDETYYGELSDMYERLQKTEDRKIILIGGSSLAFGVDVSMLEQELPGYTVCNFGLYGAIGTKVMMDLAKTEVKEGDIVILAPEISEQTMSLYFSPKDMWRAVDSSPKLLRGIGKEDRMSMLNTFSQYVSDKLSCFRKGVKPHPSDVYAHSSFDENCSMVFERDYNIMPQMYDKNVIVSFSTELITKEFVDYLNEFYQYCYRNGASVYYEFCPVNRLAAKTENTESFCNTLREALQFPVIGNPDNYIFDAEWFYDSNFHMNTSGMIVYSTQLLEDVKLAAEIDSNTRIEMPQKPIVPDKTEETEISDDGLFVYEQDGNGYQITGITEKGRDMEELIIPEGVLSIKGKIFNGCSNLKRLVLQSAVPECTVDAHLMDGVEQLEIILPDYESYLEYAVNYYWSQYAEHMSYEK